MIHVHKHCIFVRFHSRCFFDRTELLAVWYEATGSWRFAQDNRFVCMLHECRRPCSSDFRLPPFSRSVQSLTTEKP